MALIENTVGTLPYLMTDFDQHSYEATDAFTRFMPANKLHTAVRPVEVPGYDRKVLLANNKLLEEQRLTQRTQFDLEMMNELG